MKNAAAANRQSMKVAHMFVNAPFRLSRLRQLAGLVAIACLGGCEVDHADSAISCRARTRVIEVLLDPSAATIMIVKEIASQSEVIY